jgi:hypothetical protein
VKRTWSVRKCERASRHVVTTAWYIHGNSHEKYCIQIRESTQHAITDFSQRVVLQLGRLPTFTMKELIAQC